MFTSPAFGHVPIRGFVEELYFVRGRFYIQADLGFTLQDVSIYKENVVLPAANLAD